MDKDENLVNLLKYVRLHATEVALRSNEALKAFFPKPTSNTFPEVGTVAKLAEIPVNLSLLIIAEALFKARRRRIAISADQDIFHDPAWDIMIDLYMAYGAEKYVSVTSASMATNVPQTTALRHVWHLESLGLIARTIDPKDKRRQFLALTNTGVTMLEQILRNYEAEFRSAFSTSNIP